MTTSFNTLIDSLLSDDSQKKYLLTHWGTMVGDLKNHVRIERMSKDTLVLGVYEAVWLAQLYLLSDDILTTITQHLPDHSIKQLRFIQVARYTPQQRTTKTLASEKQPTRDPLPHDAKAALEKIKDPELAHALENYWFCRTKYRSQ